MTVWRKSSYSGGATDEVCVELAKLPEGVGVRDSKNPEAGHLVVRGTEFAALLERIKDGAFDRLP